MKTWKQLGILLWKNFLVLRRHPVFTLMQVFLPLVACSVVVFVRTMPTSQQEKASTTVVVPESQEPPWDPLKEPFPVHTVYYVPRSPYTERLMREVIRILQANQNGTFTAEPMILEINLELLAINSSKKVMGIVFENLDTQSNDPPQKLSYRIRTSYTMNLDSVYPSSRSPGPNTDDGGYSASGFLTLQAAVDRAHTELISNQELPYRVLLQAFPYPKHLKNDRLSLLFGLMPLLIICALVIMSPTIVVRVVQEKRHEVKEMLRLMGMSDLCYWLSTFLTYMILLLPICVIVTIMFKVPFKEDAAVLDFTDGTVFFLMMLLYSTSFVTFSMAITPFFNRPNIAVIFDVLIFYCLSYCLPIGIVDPVVGKQRYVSPAAKVASSIFPNMALHWGCRLIAAYEAIGVGVRWSNLFQSPNPDENLSLGPILTMMLLSIVLNLLILWYFDAVWPWQRGIPRPFCFPFQRSYWMGRKSGPREEDALLDYSRKDDEKKFFEEEPTDLTPGISVWRLRKAYGKGMLSKVAVRDVTMNAFKDEITVLLGHNGAGKTTFLKTITGMFPPRSGMVHINGYDVVKETWKARESLGLCPQHDILYDELTVQEHLAFYAALKGFPSRDLPKEVEDTLRLLQMQDKRDTQVMHLSGGTRRKLCLGIAYVGGSKVLVLDEPTSGMDPQARRATWDLLHGIRQGRTILLTTHGMREADILGDRIAIMVDGELRCFGSPMFLKHTFNAGYQLRIAKGKNCRPDAIAALVKKHVPNAYLRTTEAEGFEMQFMLETSQSSKLPALFRELENRKQELGIDACGISMTTMEDIFLKVRYQSDLLMPTKDKEGKPLLQQRKESVESLQRQNLSPEEIDNIIMRQRLFGVTNPALMTKQMAMPGLPPLLTGSSLIAQQFRSLVAKRLHYTMRNWTILYFQVVIPFLVWMVVLLTTSKKTLSGGERFEPPHRDLDLHTLFGSTSVFYTNASQGLADTYVSLMRAHKHEVTPVDNATSFILDIASRDMQRYRTEYIVGAGFSDSNGSSSVVAWFNREAMHTPAITLNAMSVAILNSINPNFSIVSKAHPLPSHEHGTKFATMDTRYRLVYAAAIPFALSFMSSSYVVFPVHECATKCKLLQLMSGVSSYLFWGANFLCDFMLHFVLCILMLMLTITFDRGTLFVHSFQAFASLFVLLLLYGWCSISFAYVVSFLFSKPSSGFALFMLFNLVVGLSLSTTMVVVQPLMAHFDSLLYVMRFLPTFSVTWGIENIQSIGRSFSYCSPVQPRILETYCATREQALLRGIIRCCREVCEGEECVGYTNPFSLRHPGSGFDMLILFLLGVLFYLLLNIIDTDVLHLLYHRLVPHPTTNPPASAPNFSASQDEDEDIQEERQQVQEMVEQNRQQEEALVVNRLSKKFRRLVAVHNISFAVHKEECFGLLGVHGAGKTTMFRMLTGDLKLSDGNAYIGEYDLRRSLKEFQGHVGYCPQHNPLLDRLTGREMLTLFACIRGVQERSVGEVVDRLIRMVGLKQHADKMTKNYSGGNCRKLSLAIALIGAPPILLLDEPTSGVDPVSRRMIWATLIEYQMAFHTSIMLTSHSMEECEMLCSRLAIMVEGEFRCIGSLQHLRRKFGKGYTVIAKIRREKALDAEFNRRVREFIEKQFPSASLKDIHEGILHYHVTDPNTQWSHLFSCMEVAKKQFDLEDYIVSDTTLEQIFLTFARTRTSIDHQEGQLKSA